MGVIYMKLKFYGETNMRLGNDALVVTNISRVTKGHYNQVYADAHALPSEAFKLEEKDSAVAKLKVAAEFTKNNQERAINSSLDNFMKN
jgi:hypothetical protein